MNEKGLTPSGKPYDIHERLLEFAVEIVNAAQFLHTRGPIGRALSYQLLSAGTSTGSNAEESDGASSHDDFIAKNRIALKEGKESRFRQTNWSESSPRSYTTHCGIVRSGAPPVGNRARPDDDGAPTTNRTLNLEPRTPLGIEHYALPIAHWAFDSFQRLARVHCSDVLVDERAISPLVRD